MAEQHPTPEQAEADARRLIDAAPVNLGTPSLYPWMDAAGLPADPDYRKAFRHALLMLRMARASRAGQPAQTFEEPVRPNRRGRGR